MARKSRYRSASDQFPTPSRAVINRFLDDLNAHSKPFEWVPDPKKIIAGCSR